MLSQQFKGEVTEFLRPFSLYLQKIKIYPNQLTVFGLIFSLLAAVAYAFGHLRLGGLTLLISGISDILDGSLARTTGKSSLFGAFIDSVTDRYSEFFVFFGILILFHRSGDTLHMLVLMAAMMGSIMVSYTRARAESIIDTCQVGLMERTERVLILIIFSLIGYLEPAIWILAIGANVTALRRVVYTYRNT